MAEMPRRPTFTVHRGIRERYRFPDDPPVKVYEHHPELDVFMLDDEYVSREMFEAAARQWGIKL